MMMPEAERQFYLGKAGIHLWYARKALPGAAPSPEFAFPEHEEPELVVVLQELLHLRERHHVSRERRRSVATQLADERLAVPDGDRVRSAAASVSSQDLRALLHHLLHLGPVVHRPHVAPQVRELLVRAATLRTLPLEGLGDDQSASALVKDLSGIFHLPELQHAVLVREPCRADGRV